jgi:hypothetical protein
MTRVSARCNPAIFEMPPGPRAELEARLKARSAYLASLGIRPDSYTVRGEAGETWWHGTPKFSLSYFDGIKTARQMGTGRFVNSDPDATYLITSLLDAVHKYVQPRPHEDPRKDVGFIAAVAVSIEGLTLHPDYNSMSTPKEHREAAEAMGVEEDELNVRRSRAPLDCMARP